MRTKFIILCVLVIFSASCQATSPEVIAHPNLSDAYMVFYDPIEVINSSGPGIQVSRAETAKAADAKEAQAIWDRQLEIAVPLYMQKMGITPAECADGITVLSSGQDENFRGITAFRCAQR